MTTDLKVRFPDKTNPVATDWPSGEPKNISSPTEKDGTPWEQSTVKDLMANLYAMLNSAGILANDTPDTALISQYMNAFVSVVSGASFYVATGPANTIALTAVKQAASAPEKRFNPATVKDGMRSTFLALATNTGVTTANHGGLGAIPVVFKGVALTGGEIVIDKLVTLVYDEANNRHEIESLHNLTDAFDVTTEAYADGQIPTWDSGSGKFIAQLPPSGEALNAISRTDVGYAAIKGGIDGDLLVQWGKTNVPADTSTTTATFVAAFANASAYGVATVYDSSGTGEQDNWAVNSKLAGSFKITNGQNQTLDFYWVAIGYE